MLDSDVGTQELLLGILSRVIDLNGVERESAIRKACGGDVDLESEVRRLLESEAEVGAFLGEPAEETLALLASGGTDQPPKFIGRYEVIRQLGMGGMGNVYLATQKLDDFDRPVAVKVIKRGMDSDAVINRFRIERNILGSLNHPNIAQLLDAGTTEDGRAYFAMEFVDGTRITDYCDERRLSVGERLAVFDTICRAVHYAHQNVVVHRDLKPSNILVTASGDVKLLDFGVAKLLDPGLVGFTVPITGSADTFVTPEYASPEQLCGENVSTSSDVFSLGVLLYELLSGRRPFGSAKTTRVELIRAICNDEPAKPSTVVETTADAGIARGATGARLAERLRGDLDTIVMRAICKEPGDRYASVEQLREDVRRFTNGEPILARPATLRYRFQKLYARNRRGVTAVAVMLIGIIGLTAFYIHDLQEQRTMAQVALRKAEGVERFVVGLFEQGTYSDDGTTTIHTDEQMRAAMTLIEPALEKLDQFDDDPVTKLAVLNVVAEVLTMNENPERAMEVLALAREVEHSAAATPAERAETDFVVARAFFEMGERDSAFVYADRSYATRSAVLGALDPKTLRSLAFSVRAATDTSVSHKRSRLGAERYAKVFGDVSVELANYLSDTPAPPGEGRAWFERAVDIYRQTTGLNHPLAATTMATLALIVEKDDSTRAFDLTHQAHQVLEERLGQEHSLTLQTLTNLGAMHAERSNFVVADSMLGAVEVRSRLRNPDFEPWPSLNYWRGVTMFALGDNAGAEARLRRVRDVIPPSHSRYGDTVATLGHAIARQGRTTEAIGILQSAIEAVKDLPENGCNEAELSEALQSIGVSP